MSVDEKLAERLRSAGSLGIKKTDLRKEFAEDDIELVLDRLATQGQIFIDKKGAAYYCWHKDYYVQNLLNSDPRFKLTYDEIKSFEHSVNKTFDGLARSIETLANSISTLTRLTQSLVDDGRVPETKSVESQMIGIEQFKDDFDLSLSNCSSSIGWVELAKVRDEVCKKRGIPDAEFYRLVEQLTNKYHDKYELSTGGYEGVIVRGLLHGFVRCI